MAEGLTLALGEFVSKVKLEDAPKEALPVVRTGFVDCVGCMIAGSVEDPPRILEKVLQPGPGKSSLYLTGLKVTTPEAAWINGTAAHALDFDDVSLRGHPSTVLVPAILAEAEALGSSGAEMAAAYLAGYETWAELVFRDPDQHHSKGWHPTGIFGSIGAAAACASLRKLSPEKAAQAIALGASQSSGLMANFGTMTKPFHAGRSAHSGVIAARLAEQGFTASTDAIEHAQGFLAAVSPAGKVDRNRPVEVGKDWKILLSGLGVKKYPLCYCTHRALDGILDMLKENPLKALDIKSIAVSTSRRDATILRNKQPQTGLEAKFSMQFAMATSVVAGRAGLKELTDDFVRRNDIQELMPRVTVIPDDRDGGLDGHALYDQITIETTDGRTLVSPEINQIRGGATSPLSSDDLWSKFEECCAVANPQLKSRPIFDAFMNIERQPSVSSLSGIRA
jgi:2-methylcitrate dehydratase PrpD